METDWYRSLFDDTFKYLSKGEAQSRFQSLILKRMLDDITSRSAGSVEDLLDTDLELKAITLLKEHGITTSLLYKTAVFKPRLPREDVQH